MQLESQCVRIQLQEYRSGKFVKNTSKQMRVFNAPVDDLMVLIKTAIDKATSPPPPIPVVVVAKVPKSWMKPPKSTERKERKARGPLSNEAKAQIAASQAARWANIPPEKRVLAADVRDKISATQKARWATRRKSWAESRTQPVVNDDTLFVRV